MPRIKWYNQDEMHRRKRYRLAFVRQHIDKFIQADVYAEENNIRLGYDWHSESLRNCPAAVFLLTEIKKVIHYAASLAEFRTDVWHSLYSVTWKKRVRPTIENYDYLVHREKQKKIAAASDPMSMLFP